MALIYGAHMSIAKGFPAAVLKTSEYGANAMQIFTKSPRGGIAKPIPKTEADKFKRICKSNNIIFIVAHCSYLLNFAKPLPLNHWSINDFILDLKRINLLGGVGVVLHVGKKLEYEYKNALAYLTKNITTILSKTNKLDNFIIFENTAGQGSEMGYSFEQLGELYKKLKKHKRIKFCLDTQHSFAAGYDWRNKNSITDIFKQFEKHIGIKNLSCIHFNDALKEYNTRVDRHQNIGKGYIGETSLKNIAKFAYDNSIPIIIETPQSTLTHNDDLEKIKNWFNPQ